MGERVTILSYAPVDPPAWCAEFVGIPYELKGRTKAGADCWGLCWIVLEEVFGISTPAMSEVAWDKGSTPEQRRAAANEILKTSVEFFDPVIAGLEQPGDIITLAIAGDPLHMGIVVAPGWMLHSAHDADAALERYDGMMWKKRVTGFYRVRQND